MPKTCIVCSIEASQDVLLQYCARCQSAVYCSRACQRIDWKKLHRGICKLLNVGHGDMQVQRPIHISRSNLLKEQAERNKRTLDEEGKRFFKLFEESTFEGSRAAARKMRKIAKRQTKHNQKLLLFHSVHFLIYSSNSEMLSWPSSPFLVMLQFVDPNVLSGDKETSITPLHHLADLADPFDYSTHVNQLILAKQLIEHGANVNAVSFPHGITPLYHACHSINVTNLDFVELLLEKGADPNTQDHLGMIPLIYTAPHAPGAAKFLLNWPSTDANITERSGAYFLDRVRLTITTLSDDVEVPGNPCQVQDQFQLQQWRDIEGKLLERGATAAGKGGYWHGIINLE
jgi:hypothetical protein